MSPLRLRPEVSVPWPALAVFAAVLYVVRSALRGWDFRPTAIDLLIWGGFAAILVVRALFVASMHRDGDNNAHDERPPGCW